MNGFTCLETKQIPINQRRLIIPTTRSLSMVNWTAILQEQSAGCCRITAGLIENRRHARSQLEEKRVKTGECKHRRPRFHAGNYSSGVVKRRRLHGSTNARRSGRSTRVLFTPCTVLQACYFSSARSRHPLIPSTPLVATIALFLLDTPHRNPAACQHWLDLPVTFWGAPDRTENPNRDQGWN